MVQSLITTDVHVGLGTQLIIDQRINITLTSSSSLVLTARKKQEMAMQRRYLGRACV